MSKQLRLLRAPLFVAFVATFGIGMNTGLRVTIAQTEGDSPKVLVIDGHRHVGDGGVLGNHFMAPHLIEEMNRLGIDKAVILPMGKMPATAQGDQQDLAKKTKALDEYFSKNIVGDVVRKLQSDRVDHTEVSKAIRLYPSRLIGVYMLNPWLGKPGLEEAEHAIREQGYRGIKLHPMLNAFRADDEIVDPALKLARRLNVPVMFHTSFGPGTEPERVAKVAARFPDVKVIMYHPGIGKFYKSAIEAAKKHRNIFLDTAHAEPVALQAFLDQVPAEQIIFGSDAPWGKWATKFDLVRKATQTRPDVQRMVMGANMARVLGLRFEAQPDVIEIRHPKLLPAKIPCSRIALGTKGDYKPCIAKLPNGELLIVAFDASHKKIEGGFREDMLLWRSRDGGRTWSKRQVLPLLGREPYFSVLKDGTLLITVHFLKQDIRNKEGYTYSLIHRSTDGGRTWQSTKIGWEDVPGAPENATIVTSRNVLELKDGTLIFGVSAPGGINYLWKSKDGGKSWNKTLSCDFEGVAKSKLWWPFMGETIFWQARNGDLLGLFRVDPKLFPSIPGTTIPQSNLDQYERLLLFRSKNGGGNWSPEEFGSYYGEMYPALLRLNDGRLLLTFTLRTAVVPNTKPLGVRCLVGRETNEGFGFDFEHDRIMISAKTPVDSLSGGGFGPTTQLADGTLLTAYSYAGKDRYPTDLRIEVVRWRLPNATPEETKKASTGKEER